MMEVQQQNLAPLTKMMKDIKEAAVTLTDTEARYLVDSYYQMQDNRIRFDGQIRSIVKGEENEPHEMLAWLSNNSRMLEEQMKLALKKYAESKAIGRWCMTHKGIGPVITAGIIAHIDINKAQTAGAIWKYAGLDPDTKWEKKTKRPWNAQLKVLCWKLGESFVKVSGKDDAFYGKLYAERKEQEVVKNEAGEFAEQAKKKLETCKIDKKTDAYKAYSQGKLPPAHIHARAKRYAVKMFLSHLFEVWRKQEGLPVPNPFAIEHLGHAHKIEPPVYSHECK